MIEKFVVIPDDEDPEIYYEKMTQKIANKISQQKHYLESQKQIISDTIDNNSELKTKIETLNDLIDPDKINKIYNQQEAISEKITQLHYYSHKTRHTTYSLQYVNQQLDDIINKYQTQNQKHFETLQSLKETLTTLNQKSQDPPVLEKYKPVYDLELNS